MKRKIKGKKIWAMGETDGWMISSWVSSWMKGMDCMRIVYEWVSGSRFSIKITAFFVCFFLHGTVRVAKKTKCCRLVAVFFFDTFCIGHKMLKTLLVSPGSSGTLACLLAPCNSQAASHFETEQPVAMAAQHTIVSRAGTLYLVAVRVVRELKKIQQS